MEAEEEAKAWEMAKKVPPSFKEYPNLQDLLTRLAAAVGEEDEGETKGVYVCVYACGSLSLFPNPTQKL